MKTEVLYRAQAQDPETKRLIARISSAVENAPYLLECRRVTSIILAASCSTDDLEIPNIPPAPRA